MNKTETPQKTVPSHIGKRPQTRPVAIALAAALCFSLPAVAEEGAPSVEQRLQIQEQRLDALDQKLDKLFELLMKSPIVQGGGGSSSSAAPAKKPQARAASAPAGSASLNPGLVVEVYQIDPGDKLPSEPSGFPTALLVDANPPIFSYAAFEDKEELKRLAAASNRKWLGQLWKGMLQVTQGGPHVFSAELIADSNNRTENCLAAVSVDGESFKVMPQRIRDSETFVSEQLQVDLAPGLYPLKIWQVCAPRHWGSDIVHKKIRTILKVRGPGDWDLVPIPKARLGHYR